MTCKKCQQTNGKAHSFHRLGTLNNGASILFTCPLEAYTDDDSINNIEYYKSHFEAIPGNWIWIVDYRNFTTPLSFETGKIIIKYLLQHHKDRLKGFYIFQPSTFFNAFLSLCIPFFPESYRSKIHTYNDSILEFITDLQRAGMSSKDGHTLMLKLLRQTNI